RLRDSPVIQAGLLDFARDDIAPPEVGSLDRRGETVEMRIIPTFSVYAPFYQSSLGYGLAVRGAPLRAVRLPESHPQAIRFRFETASAPEDRRLVFHLFAGPDYATILDEYTSLVGRPIVPADWAFLHWRWRDELRAGPTVLLDGVLVNADLADDVL